MSNPAITVLLKQWNSGDEFARNAVFQQIYPELQRLASRQLSYKGPGDTLNATALVHDLYEKLARANADCHNRNHFMALAAKAMRQIITDHVRRKVSEKRGGGAHHASLDTLQLSVDQHPEALFEILDLVGQLEVLGERFVHVIECRLFAGMTEVETAEALNISRRTVQRDWSKAVAWMRLRLEEHSPASHSA